MLPLYVIGGLVQAVSCELASGPLLSSPGGAIVLLPGCCVWEKGRQLKLLTLTKSSIPQR